MYELNTDHIESSTKKNQDWDLAARNQVSGYAELVGGSD